MGTVRYKSVALALAVMVLGVCASLHQPLATRAASDARPVDSAVASDWPAYNGGADGDHYSSLSQITPLNVAGLKQAWRVDVGSDGALQTNPLVVGRVVYG